MKLISIALGLLLLSTPAFAGLPPTTAKGQLDTSPITTFNFQTPNKLATKVVGGTLMENGNKNILANPSFEAVVNGPMTGWSWTGILTTSADSTVVIDGKQSQLLQPPNQALDFHADSTLYQAQFADGVQGLAYMRVKTTLSTTPLYVCPRKAGAYPAQMTSGCVQVQPTGKWGLYKVPFILGGTSNGIGITTNGVAVTDNIYVDDAFVGAVDLKVDSNPVGPWIDYGAMTIGATTTAPTKATTREYDKVRCRINGQDYECEYLYRASSATGAAVGSGVYIWSLPSGIVMDSSVPLSTNTTGAFAYSGTHAVGSIGYGDMEYSGNGDTGTKCDLFATSTTTFQAACFFGGTGVLQPSSSNAAINNTDYSFRWHVKFRGAGLASNYSAYSTTNANYSRVAYTPTFTGLGTTSSVDCGHSRSGQYLDLDCKWTSTTSTAVEARVSLPTVNGVALTPATASIRPFGTAGLSAVGDQAISVLGEPSNNYVTFGFQGASGAGLTKQTGSGWLGTGTITVAFTARIPISQWDNSNAIIGQFSEMLTTPGVATPIVFGATINNTTLTNNEGGVITSSSCSAGAYTINLTGITSVSRCSAAIQDAGVLPLSPFNFVKSSSSVTFKTVNNSGTGVCYTVDLTCNGVK